MAEENPNEKSASGGPKGAPVARQSEPATTAEETRKANDDLRKSIDAGANERAERQRAASLNSKATTDAHLGKRPDEPHKPREMEAIKVGKPVPVKEHQGVGIDPAKKGVTTDIVLPGGYPPSSPMHHEDGPQVPAHAPDAAGTIAAVAEATDGQSVKVVGDPNAQAGKDAHAGENAKQPDALPTGLGRGGDEGAEAREQAEKAEREKLEREQRQ
jgi:hypothetical protein